MNIKTLIHTALTAEAKVIIGNLNLECIKRDEFKIYCNDSVVLIVSGIGAENTKKALNYIKSIYKIEIFINFGMAGCTDESIEIGSLFCTNNNTLDIEFATISSHKNAITNKENIDTLLVDMESEAFLQSCPKDKKVYVFKVVSDHLSDKILSKAEVGNLVQKSFNRWIKYAR